MSLLDASVVTDRTAWDDVVAEIRTSVARRVTGDAHWQAEGSFGVLRGAAPVIWVHDATDVERLTAALSSEQQVDEVYVAAGEQATIDRLVESGWAVTDVVDHLVHRCIDVPTPSGAVPAIVPLQPGDLADIRALLVAHGGMTAAAAQNAYSDEFFTVAAPAWMFGARDGSGRLVGLVAIRRQDRAVMGFALTVDPAWWASGLSTALIAAGLEQASLIGAEFVHAQANDRSRARLLACGFDVAGTWQQLTRA